jgi:transposase-like protein
LAMSDSTGWPMTFIAVRCPHCQSEQIVKRGKTRRGTQRYLCQNTACTTGSFLLDCRNRGCLPEVKHTIVDMSLNASGIRDTARKLRPLNLSYFVAREIWRSRSVLPLPDRAHRLQRRKSLRCLPGLMDTTFDLLQTAINRANVVCCARALLCGETRDQGTPSWASFAITSTPRCE